MGDIFAYGQVPRDVRWLVEGGWGLVARLGVVLWLCGRCYLCSGLEEDGCEDVNSVVISKNFLFCHGTI